MIAERIISRRTRHALCFGAFVTVLQVLMALLASGGSYHDLAKWDSGWYSSIIDFGYHSTIPPVSQRGDLANVGFFPGYPLFAYLIKKALFLDTGTAEIVSAQLACAGFWAYFYLLLTEMNFGIYLIIVLSALMFAQPGSFFLVTGYSESLFLCALMGFVYWVHRGIGKNSHFWLAAGHGAVLTATRVVGSSLVLYPVILVVMNQLHKKDWKSVFIVQWNDLFRPMALCVLSQLGMLVFFLYCQIAIGKWDIYFDTARIGWGVNPRPYMLTSQVWLKWAFTGATFKTEFPNETGRGLTEITLVLLVCIGLWFWRRRSILRKRKRLSAQTLGLFIVSWLLLVQTIYGRMSLQLVGMLRYLLTVNPLVLLLCGTMVSLEFPKLTPSDLFRRKSGWVIGVPALILLAVILFLSLKLQLGFATRFVRSQWVA